MNQGGKTAGITIKRNLHERMEAFDAMPPEFRELIRYAHTQMGGDNPAWYWVNRDKFEAIRAQIEERQRKSTRLTYGADHPQANRDKAEELLYSLGML